MAFNILLAGVPFMLLLASGLGFLLGATPDASAAMVQDVLDSLLPTAMDIEGSMLDPVMTDVVRTRTAFGIGGAIGFLIFSARLFKSLRSVMMATFAHRGDRTMMGGMLWDIQLSVISAVLLAGWVVLSAWIGVSSGSVGEALTDVGVLANVMTTVQYVLFRLLSFALLCAVFAALYHWLPKKRTPWISALAGGIGAALLFELARVVFGILMRTFPPGSIYTGTLGAVVVIVFWTYYVGLIFVIGAVTASAMEAQLRPKASDAAE